MWCQWRENIQQQCWALLGARERWALGASSNLRVQGSVQASGGWGAQWSTGHNSISDITFNIIPYVYMISYMISRYDIKLHIVWYWVWPISYDIGYSYKPYDIIVKVMIYFIVDRVGSTVGSTLCSCAQGPGFEPGLFHDAHDVPVLCQLAIWMKQKLIS